MLKTIRLPLLIAIFVLLSLVTIYRARGASEDDLLVARSDDAISVRSGYKDLSSLMQQMVKKHDMPAMWACVIRGGTISALGCAGTRVRNLSDKVEVDDPIHLGSCTKSMTAFVCAELVQRKFLRWNTKLLELWPELAKTMDPAYKNVTLTELLTHRSGLPANTNYMLYQKQAPNSLVRARQLLMKGVLAEKPAVRPGTFLYSNVGYIIAGHMAEKVTGKSWEELIKRDLFTPLGMTTAGFGAPEGLNAYDVPWGHDSQGKAIRPGPSADNPAIVGPAGRVHCSIKDWASYCNLQLEGAQGKALLLTANSYKKLQTPISTPPPSYAMGWGVSKRNWAEGTVLTHTGSNTCWYTVVWLAPHRDFGVLVACNQGGELADKACDDVAWSIIQQTVDAGG